ncbi:MAG: SulP family inorganic anion transporter [Solirubrobacterales bacterium]
MTVLFGSLRDYKPEWLRSDLLAGLTVWAVLVPEALAYASIAGVSPVVGLYAAPGALLLYAALGSSRQLVTGPMAATAALSAATVGDLVAQSSGDQFLAFTTGLAIAAGVAALAAGVLRLGFLANFISEPVLKGFIVGLALTIVIGQVPKLFGVESGSGDFFESLWGLLGNLGETNVQTLLVGVLSLAVVLGLKRWAPSVPGSLVAVVLGVAAVAAFGLDGHGVAIVGHVESGLPSVGTPDLSLSDYGDLAAGGVGVMLVGFAEGLGAAKNYAARERREIDPNRELLGLGGANLAAGLSGGMVVNGSLSKTAVNASAGARTQLAGVVVAALTVVTLLALTGLFEDLPEATLAAIVIAAVIELVDFPALADLSRVYTRRLGAAYGAAARPDFIAAVAAMFGVLIFDTLPGLFIGIGVALLLLLYRASRPHVAELGQSRAGERFDDLDRHPEARPVPGVIVLRVESGLFFANAEGVRDRIRAAASSSGAKAVVLDAESVPFIDVSAARMLDAMAEELARDGLRLLVARDVGQVRDVLGKVSSSGRLELCASVREAVARTQP